ncbi:MAG: hypothetical protein KGY74_00065 [Candidatus Cloacimonetes bacterium]|nr:hypothetical protein [Candidatus Cloacimonadota bacterium]
MLYIFEDKNWKNFLPIAYTRPVFDLRTGIFKLKQKIKIAFKNYNVAYLLRPELEAVYTDRFPNKKVNVLEPGKHIFVNATSRLNSELINTINNLKDNEAIFYNDTCLAFRKNIEQKQSLDSTKISGLYSTLKKKTVDNKPYQYTWELIESNASEIKNEFSTFSYIKKKNYFSPVSYYFTNTDKNIFFGADVKVEPGVYLDAIAGPIIIDDNAKIMANAVIKGPTYIGKNSKIKASAKIYEGTSIGKVCKVGGEVEETIIQAYSNKQHDGFLGHAYLGEWVNIGADTNNSDLKNNYEHIKAYSYTEDNLISTNMQFFGLLMGDHTKTGINTMFNTGSVVGIGCNLFGSELFKGFIPSFSLGEGDRRTHQTVYKMIETARKVKNRRNLELTNNEAELLRSIYEKTKQIRRKYNKRKRN